MPEEDAVSDAQAVNVRLPSTMNQLLDEIKEVDEYNIDHLEQHLGSLLTGDIPLLMSALSQASVRDRRAALYWLIENMRQLILPLKLATRSLAKVSEPGGPADGS